MRIKMLFATLLTLTLWTTGNAQTLDKAKLDQFFDRLAEKNKGMGSLTIAKDGQVLYTRSIGYGEISGSVKKPLTEATRFRIASITKMYTAVMILQLAEEGKLKLTDTLDKFYPQVPNASEITIEQVLRHRSGIPNVRRNAEGQPNINTLPITKDEMLELVVKARPDFEPGTKQSYSNSGYFLLGLIIEKVGGKPYSQALSDRINSKIGLKDTYTATGNIDVSKNESQTYLKQGSGWVTVPETHPSILFGAGAIVSTPSEMANFIKALFDVRLISQQNLTAMKTVGSGDELGLGMEPFTFAGKTFYGHAGGGDNYGSWLAYQPEEKLAVAYTTNAKVFPVVDIIKGVVDIYYNRPFQIPSFESVTVSAEVLDKYVGVYSTTSGPVKFTITREGSTLYIQPPGQSKAPLEAIAQDKFTIDAGVVFEFDASKGQMIIKRSGGERLFTKDK